jgi:hypothetical protein
LLQEGVAADLKTVTVEQDYTEEVRALRLHPVPLEVLEEILRDQTTEAADKALPYTPLRLEAQVEPEVLSLTTCILEAQAVLGLWQGDQTQAVEAVEEQALRDAFHSQAYWVRLEVRAVGGMVPQLQQQAPQLEDKVPTVTFNW